MDILVVGISMKFSKKQSSYWINWKIQFLVIVSFYNLPRAFLSSSYVTIERVFCIDL